LKPHTNVRGRVLPAAALAACMTMSLSIPAAAQSGGSTTPPAKAKAPAQPSAPAKATLALRSTRHVLVGRSARVRGRVTPAVAGRTVRLQARMRGSWRTVARTRTGRGGSFRLSWRAPRAGSYAMRVRLAAGRASASSMSSSPAVRSARALHVYRTGHASWYGPGFMGGRTACGQTLHGGLKGVAHKYLPCGTKVRFRYRGRTTVARVVDRGPFIAGRTWDLTPAVKRALGFGSTGTVWATR